MCASRLLRRSGVAVGLIADVLGWRADVIVQVGVGQYHEESAVLSQEWPKARWIGFEPHPEIFRGITDYPGGLQQQAIGSYTGKAILYAKQHHKDGSSLFRHKPHDGQEMVVEQITVEISTLDHLLPDGLEGKVLLWLDCEGSELDVLHGADRFIKCVDVVNVELASCPPCNGWCQPEEVHHWLVNHGFFRQWVHTGRISAGQVDAVYVKRHLFRPDYCCDPWERERFWATE